MDAAQDSESAQQVSSLKKPLAALGLFVVLIAVGIWGVPDGAAWTIWACVAAMTLVLVAPLGEQ